MRTLRILATALLVVATFAIADAPRAEAQTGRVALVIANAAYPDSDAELPTPIGDAAALGEELTRRGYAVEVARNLTKDGMQAAVDGFLRRIEPGSVALVFYGGYAIQAARKNYLIPVDARIWSEPDVLREGFGTDALLADMAKRGASARVLVLDASRRNPFERRYRSFSTGLAPAPALAGSLVLSSAPAGSVVNENAATRSLFVTELIKQVGLPALSAEQAFGATRDALSRATRGQQVPALVSGLEESFSFDPDFVKPPAPKTPPPQAAIEVKPPVQETKPPPVEPKPEMPAVASDPTPNPPAGKTEPQAEASLPEAAPKPAVSADVPEPEVPPVAEEAKPSPPTQVATKEPDAPLAAEAQAVRDFEDARAIGSREAYQDFLAAHPAGALAAQAKAEIARIEAVARPQPASPAEQSYTPAERQRKAVLDQRIAKNPRDEQAYYERGQFHAQRKEAGPAIADFDQSIRMNPANPDAFNNRCWMQAVAGALDRALSDCDQALKLRPNYVDALDSRGFVNLKASRFRAAVADYDAALRLAPSHSSALYGRGIAKRRLGLTGQAERDFAGALQLDATIGEEFAGYGLR